MKTVASQIMGRDFNYVQSVIACEVLSVLSSVVDSYGIIRVVFTFKDGSGIVCNNEKESITGI